MEIKIKRAGRVEETPDHLALFLQINDHYLLRLGGETVLEKASSDNEYATD